MSEYQIANKSVKNRIFAALISCLMMGSFLGDLGVAAPLSVAAEETDSTAAQMQDEDSYQLLGTEEKNIPIDDTNEEAEGSEDLELLDELIVPSFEMTPITDEEYQAFAVLRSPMKPYQLMAASGDDTVLVVYDSEYYTEQAEGELLNFSAKYDYSQIAKGDQDTDNFIYADSNFSFNYNIFCSSNKEIEPGCLEIIVPAELFEWRDDNAQTGTSADHISMSVS